MATKKPKPPFRKSKTPPRGKSTTAAGSLLGRGAAAMVPTVRPRPASPPPVAPTPPPIAKQTPGAKQEATQLIADIKQLRADIASNFYRMGQKLRDLHRPERYRALAYNTFKEALEGEQLLTFPQARKLIRIVDAFSEPVALTHGVEKAAEIIRLAEHRRVAPTDLLRQDPELEIDPPSGPPTRIRLSVMRPTDLAIYVNTLINPAHKPGRARVQRLSRGIAQALDNLGIDPDRVRTIRRRSGTHVVRIELPPDEAEELLAFIKKRKR